MSRSEIFKGLLDLFRSGKPVYHKVFSSLYDLCVGEENEQKEASAYLSRYLNRMK